MASKDGDYVESHSHFDSAVRRADQLARHDGDRRKVTVKPGGCMPYQITKTGKKK